MCIAMVLLVLFPIAMINAEEVSDTETDDFQYMIFCLIVYWMLVMMFIYLTVSYSSNVPMQKHHLDEKLLGVIVSRFWMALLFVWLVPIVAIMLVLLLGLEWRARRKKSNY
jgi:NADH:ubiquinone oxidoreductase subunit 6 (subunit J)